MRSMIFIIPLLLSGCFWTGCIGTSMPRETAMLSQQLGPELQEAKRVHYADAKSWRQAKRDLIEVLLHYSWVPKHIQKTLAKDNTHKILKEEFCGAGKGSMDAALVMQELIEDMQVDVEARRDLGYREIDYVYNARIEALDYHYGNIELMYNALNANVLSIQKGLEMEKGLREAIAKPINKLIPLEKARTGFDKLFKLGDK